MTGNQTRVRIPSALKNNGDSPLISNAKARQLYELALRFTALRGRPGAASWLRGREGVLAALMGDLHRGDTVVSENPSALHQALSPHAPGAAPSPMDVTLVDLKFDLPGSGPAVPARRNGRVTVILLPAPNGHAILHDLRSAAFGSRLPLLFVQDHPPQTNDTTAKTRRADSMPAVPVDVDDVVALYRVAHESIARARNGGGPTEIVCVRWRTSARAHAAHSARTAAIARLEHWLLARGLPVQAWRDEITAHLEASGATGPATDADAGEAQPFAPDDIQPN